MSEINFAYDELIKRVAAGLTNIGSQLIRIIQKHLLTPIYYVLLRVFNPLSSG